jgi:hypothetical protein
MFVYLRAPRGGWIGDPVKFNTNSHTTLLRKLERLSILKLVLVNIDNQGKSHKRHAIFIPWFGQVTLAYFHVVASQWMRVALNPFQVIRWSTLILRFFLSLSFSRLRGISTAWSLSPLQWRSQKMYGSKGGESNTHNTQITVQSRTQVTTWAQNTTLGVHNSNGAQVTISKNQMRKVRVLEA